MPRYLPQVVAFKGRILQQHKASLEALGATIYGYAGENSLLVRLPEEMVGEVSNLPFVNSVEEYGGEHKVKALKALSEPLTRGDQLIKLMVKIFELDDLKEALGCIKSAGAEVLGLEGCWLEVESSMDSISKLTACPGVMSVEEAVTAQLLNDQAAQVVSAPYAWSREYKGEGQIICVADTGLDTGVLETLHGDFRDKVAAMFCLGRAGDCSDFVGHGTHVAATALGSGEASRGQYKGIGNGAKLVMQSLLGKEGGLSGMPRDLNTLLLQAYQTGARVHSNSWGAEVKGEYNYMAAQMDQFIWKHDDMVVVAAAGNSGGSGTINAPASAKNVICVGASENNRPDKGTDADNYRQVAYFSSRGPAADGRIKPDLLAPGTWVLSARSTLAKDSYFQESFDEHYAYSSGTSMATPVVAGAVAVVRGELQGKYNISPSAALVKAVLINGCRSLPEIPLKDQGWGLLSLEGSDINEQAGFMFDDNKKGLATGEMYQYRCRARGGGQPLKATLVWSDYPGLAGSKKALVNDLDLEVKSPRGAVRSTGDRINNVEQIYIDRPEDGVHLITVKGHHVPMGRQKYALFVSGGELAEPDNSLPAPVSPPRVQIVSPADQSNVRGIVYLRANINTEADLSRVEFFMDEIKMATYDYTNFTAEILKVPVYYKINAFKYARGHHVVAVRAKDALGKLGEAKLNIYNV